MNHPNNQKLAPSCYKVESNAGLTFNFAQAHLPVGPSLLPPAVPPAKEESSFLGGGTVHQNPVFTPVIPPIPDLGCNTMSATRTSGQLRSRYVLPPQLTGTSASTVTTITGSITQPLPPLIPSTAPFVPSISLPTPVDFNVSMLPLSETELPPTLMNYNFPTTVSTLTNTTFAQSAVLPTPPEFNIQAPLPPSSTFSSTTVLPTPSCYNVSASLQDSPMVSSQLYPPQSPVEVYEPVKAHWFYSSKMNGMLIWWPFDRCDSDRLEMEATVSDLLNPLNFNSEAAPSSSVERSIAVSVRGGRYDVMLRERQCKAVYWEEEKNDVRRTTWLFRPQNEQRVLPFSEEMCAALEEHYREALESNSWGQKFVLPSENNETAMDTFIFYAPESMVQYRAYPFRSVEGGSSSPDELLEDESSHLCILHRGLRSELSSLLAQGDPRPIEHVVFVVHGIGSIYNMRREGLVECVNDMRKTCESLMPTHFPTASGRVEFLPVRWHSALHSEATGINNQLRRVTLRSVPKLRNYTNDTLMDILFYNSPKYCQHIIETVASSIVSLRRLFLQRNPAFNGTFSIVGHSLGSVIVFDLLSHQRRIFISSHPSDTDLDTRGGEGEADDDDWSLVGGSTSSQTPPDTTSLEENLREQLSQANLSEAQLRLVVKTVLSNNNTTTTANTAGGVGMPVVQYPQLGFPISTCILLGSPLPAFLTARGIDRLPYDFRLPNCPTFCNIFHPFDPVAYRMETMIVPDYKPCAVLMPHHKGRKRIHLELKENLARVGADIKSKVYQSLKSTWRTLQEFASAHTGSGEQTPSDAEETENESDAIKRVLDRLSDDVGAQGKRVGQATGDEDEEEQDATSSFPSQLNQGRRIDFILQEAPLESLNDYLFALSSHAVYWDSADCILFMLNELFTATPPHHSVRQQTLQRKETLTGALQGTFRDQLTVGGAEGSSHSSLFDPSTTSGYHEVALTSAAIAPTSESHRSSASTPTLGKHSMSRPNTPSVIPRTVQRLPLSSTDLFSDSTFPQLQQARPLQPFNHPPSQTSLSDALAEFDSRIPVSVSSTSLVEIDLAGSPK